MVEIITSLSNPLIKQARALRQKKARDENGIFLVEGLAHIGCAMEANWQIEVVIYAPDLLRSDFGLGLIRTLEQKQVRCQPVSLAVFESIAEKENPQGIAALARQRILSQKDWPATETAIPLYVALVSPQDPGNVGAILRSLDAVGGAGLFLIDGGVDPYHPSCVRASMGALFSVPFIRAGFAEFSDWVQQTGARLVGTSARAELDYRQYRGGDQPTVILLGSEQKGLSQEQLAACAERVSLPMRGKISSLNLAVAAGILLYAFADR
jgi:TrmH family RNA methyltransferase